MVMMGVRIAVIMHGSLESLESRIISSHISNSKLNKFTVCICSWLLFSCEET